MRTFTLVRGTKEEILDYFKTELNLQPIVNFSQYEEGKNYDMNVNGASIEAQLNVLNIATSPLGVLYYITCNKSKEGVELISRVNKLYIHLVDYTSDHI